MNTAFPSIRAYWVSVEVLPDWLLRETGATGTVKIRGTWAKIRKHTTSGLAESRRDLDSATRPRCV